MRNNASYRILLITSWIVIISTSLLANDFNSDKESVQFSIEQRGINLRHNSD